VWDSAPPSITEEIAMSFVLRKSRLMAFACGLSAAFALPMVPAGAQDQQPSADGPGRRPRIGLVLAGGGAKGGAHVGVLKVLEELHVPIDCIAGTSMGALVGAGYAAGLPASELETFMNGVNWKDVVGGIGRRPLEPIEQKRLAIAASSDVTLGIQDGHIVAPGGLTNTSGIDDLLRAYVARARMVADFNQLPIPYRAVATDMVTGTMVVLDHGDLATAMRASMSIPGAFAPVVLDRYILADGGQVRNIPVDVAREMCAEVVIVVNLVEPETPPEKLVEATQLVARSMDVMLEANENIQLATLTDRDVRIDVPMGDIGTADFLRVPETIPLGEAAAREVAARLSAYSVPAADYHAWRARVTTRQDVQAKVAAVQFEGLKRVNPEYLRTLTSIRPGDNVNIEAISDDALRMSALNDIDTVAYRLDGDPANPALVWLPKESSVGPDVLRPSIGIYASGGGDFKFLMGAQYVEHWLNGRGGQWRSNLQVGYESLLSTSFYQPFDVAQRYFVEPRLFASRSVEDLYVDTERVAVYRFVDVGGDIDVGVNVGRTGQLRVGYLNAKRKGTVQTGIGNLPDVEKRIPDFDTRDAGLVAGAMYDSRSADTFARHGLAAALEYVQSEESLGADRNWNRIEAGFRRAVPVGKNAMWVSLAGGSHFGDDTLPGDRAFALGGPRTLPAYQLDELRARSYWLADVEFLWRLVDLVPVKSQAIYGGFGLQSAGLYDRVDRVPDGEVYSVSAYLGGPTPIGTFTLGIGGASDSWGFWLSLGRPVGTGSILNNGLFR
jgi:NTE family protein